MKRNLLFLVLALAAMALALAACGGGGSSSSGGGEEGAIEEAIEESATSTDPASCTEFQTAAFTEQEQAASGKEAVEQCEEEKENEENVSESVTVSNISIEGETATAEAAIEGSGLNGQTLELQLVQEEGTWKMNEFAGFAKYDAATLAESLEEGLEESGEVEPELVTCLGEGFGELSQEEAEAITFEHDFSVLEELKKGCE